MTDQDQEQKKYESGEILYQGDKVPGVLRFVYVIFFIWVIVYFALYAVDDLLNWLK